VGVTGVPGDEHPRGARCCLVGRHVVGSVAQSPNRTPRTVVQHCLSRLLRDEADQTSHQLLPPTHGAAELVGVSAAGLNIAARTVLLDNGDRLPYDGLVVATGCRARLCSHQARPDQDDQPE
jgi:NADH dehydrogenase FAD-containing subunit